MKCNLIDRGIGLMLVMRGPGVSRRRNKSPGGGIFELTSWFLPPIHCAINRTTPCC